MEIYVVKPGDTLFSIALEHNVPMSQIILDNGLDSPQQLVSGQALVIRFPRVTHTVLPGETLSSIARQYGVTLRLLYQNNPVLGGRPTIWPGETIVISYQQTPGPDIFVNAYAYPYISDELLFSTLSYLSYLTPFTYGFTPDGDLVTLNDERLITAARSMGTAPLMHLSTLTQEGGFSNELAHIALNDETVQARLIEDIVVTLRSHGYRGLDVDFEYVFPEDAGAYADFLSALTRRLNPLGYPVIAALAPKTSVFTAAPPPSRCLKSRCPKTLCLQTMPPQTSVSIPN
ncbi:MAG: LysM peptidoglycan-binding domain-containing protein, partial [Oscillospiraceae bacterium]|nr:LysM peptidoglycan-binding domain-containing protein [Oscillospiraceae bacterium]